MSGNSSVIAELLGISPSQIRCTSVGGGCISQAMRVDVQEAGSPRVVQRYFVKCNDEGFLENFQAEARGLHLLAETQSIRVPCPGGVTVAEGRAWLWADWVEQASLGGTGKHDFFRRFGEQLAALHRQSQGTAIGLDHDNYLGAARQLNAPADSWVEFFADRRLGFQLRWGVEQGTVGGELKRDLERICANLDKILAGREEQTVLLHGDLWSGNYLRAADGQPVIIDPAVYYGCREAEFGMLFLFGGCSADFYEAYLNAWHLPAGWRERAKVYVLYHLLNHLNLFGASYLHQVKSMASEVLRL